MVGIKHHTTTTQPNSTDYDVSKSAWEETHDIDDGGIPRAKVDFDDGGIPRSKINFDTAGIPQAKIAADIQVIAGPEWVNPTGTGPYAIQFNTSLALSRLCWFDGTLWDYIWGGNVKIEQFNLDAGTIGVRDCFAIGTANIGTTLPGGTRGTTTWQSYQNNRPMYIGISLGNVGTVGGTVPVLVSGRIQLYSGGAISAGQAISGADSSSRPTALLDQSVAEGGAQNYTVYYSRRIGIALTTAGSAGVLFWALVAP